MRHARDINASLYRDRIAGNLLSSDSCLDRLFVNIYQVNVPIRLGEPSEGKVVAVTGS
jgi:hypothetical protein